MSAESTPPNGNTTCVDSKKATATASSEEYAQERMSELLYLYTWRLHEENPSEEMPVAELSVFTSPASISASIQAPASASAPAPVPALASALAPALAPAPASAPALAPAPVPAPARPASARPIPKLPTRKHMTRAASTAAAAASAAAAAIPRRACTLCRKRKVGCDRGLPCGRCFRAGVLCVRLA